MIAIDRMTIVDAKVHRCVPIDDQQEVVLRKSRKDPGCLGCIGIDEQLRVTRADTISQCHSGSRLLPKTCGCFENGYKAVKLVLFRTCDRHVFTNSF